MPTNNEGIFNIPPQQCVSCNGVSGGWNSVDPLTKATCESIGGISSVSAEDPPETTGACGNVLTGTCDSYMSTRFQNGVPVLPSIPWIGLGGGVNGTGTVYVNACNMAQLGVPAQYNPNIILPAENFSIDFSSLSTLNSSCASFGELHPELNTCVTGVQQYPPITINDTTITTSTTANTDSNSALEYIGLGAVVIGAETIAAWLFGGGGNGGGGGGSSFTYFIPNNSPIGSPASIVAGDILGSNTSSTLQSVLETAGYVVGGAAIAGIVIIGAAAAAPILAGGGAVAGAGAGVGIATGSILVIIYNTDGTANVITMQLPQNGI